MPKQSKKSKSKRTSRKDKVKVIKKVREHHRKQRKEAKKQGKRRPSVLKDPGVPANFPYREELVKELKFEQQRIQSNEKAKRDAQKLRRQARKAGGVVEDADMDAEEAPQLAAVQAAAAASQDAFDRSQSASQASAPETHDRTRRAFYKELRQVVCQADVVLQVLDARDPLACRSLDIERYVRSVDANKKIILVVNKVDLVPQEVLQQWLKYFREELPAVAFKASTKASGTIAHAHMPRTSGAGGAADLFSTSECLGADTLLQLLKNYCRTQGGKASVAVGVVGMPNVGKSSVINSLKRSRVAAVGNTPGVTQALQEVQLDKQIRLLDSPGVVFSSAQDVAAAALRNAIKVEQLEDPVAPVATILQRVPAKHLMCLYRTAPFDTAEQLLAQVARARGKLHKGGTPDIHTAARIVLQDWNDGRISFFARPPARETAAQQSAQVVAQYAAEFDADAVFGAEAKALFAALPAQTEKSFAEVQSAGPAEVHLAQMDTDNAAHAQPAVEESGSDMEDIVDAYPGASSMRTDDGAQQHAQNQHLYAAPGQVNPKLAKARAKSHKKAKRNTAVEVSALAEAFDPAILCDE